MSRRGGMRRWRPPRKGWHPIGRWRYLVCSDRGQHRPVVLFQWPADLELGPAEKWWRVGAALPLACSRCPRNPRPSCEVMDALVQLAAQLPNGRLDLSLLDL
jgi:hypothetical protein